MEHLTRRLMLGTSIGLVIAAPAYSALFSGAPLGGSSGPSALNVSPASPNIVDTTAAGTTIWTGTIVGGTAPFTANDLNSDTKFSLTVSGSTVTCKRSASGTLTAGTPEVQSIQITDANSLTLPSPQGVTTSVYSATGFNSLVAWTITEKTGSGQTNVPIEIFLPFGPGIFASSSAVALLDSDGVTQIGVQEDNRCSDLTPNVRGVKVTAILPTLNANEARQLTLGYKASTSPTTGTDATTADILAVSSYDCVATCVDHNGTTYTASASTGLAASTYTNKTTACNFGKFRSGGGLATEYILFVPYKNGGTPHPGNLYAKFCVTAYKNGRGAVSGGNPITAIRTQVWNECTWSDQTSGNASDNWYDLTYTSGSNTASWVGSTPGQTLTLGGNSLHGIYSATVGSSLFTANSIGMVISDGTGYGTIVGYNSATSVQVLVYLPFSGTTITSPNWKISGINQVNAGKIPVYEVWYSGLSQYPAAPINVTPAAKIDSSLGVAWTGSAGGPLAYYSSTKTLLNYSDSYTNITNDLSYLNAAGTNISAYTTTGYGNGQAGSVLMYMPQTGARGDLAPTPSWFVGALIKFDSNAKKVIFGNASKFSLASMFFADPATGLTGTPKNTAKPTVLSATNSINNWTPQVAHMPGMEFVPYIMTGDYFWLDLLQSHDYYDWNNTIVGSGLSAMYCINNEARGCGWNFRTLMENCYITPDATVAGVAQVKADVQTLFANQFTGGATPSNGANTRFTNNTGSGGGQTYATVGPRWLAYGSPGVLVSMWQLGYCVFAFYHGKELGITNTDSANFLSWLIEGLTSAITDIAEVVPQYVAPAYWLNAISGSSVYAKTWTQMYQDAAIYNDLQYGNNRVVTGAATLSATAGSSISCTLPSGTISSGGSFYVGGFIRDGQRIAMKQVDTFVGGTGYAVNDTITLQFTGLTDTLIRNVQLKVTSVSGGVVTGTSFNDYGGISVNNETSNGWLYNQSNYTFAGYATTQLSTSGSGTGFTCSMTGGFGFGVITAVSGSVATLDTTGSGGVPFASTTIPSATYFCPWPAVGETNTGVTWISSQSGHAVYTQAPIPYGNYDEYWTIATVCSYLYKNDVTDGPTCYSWFGTNYTGGFGGGTDASKWILTPR